MKDSLLGTKSAIAVKVVDTTEARDRIEQISSSIGQRAYEMFETDGRMAGHELDHWLRAETELLHPIHVEIAESDDVFVVRAEVPGYKPEAIEVCVDPRHVTIIGVREAREWHKTDKIIYTEHCADRIFRSLELPVKIDVSKSTATLKDGVVEIAMPRATEAAKARSATQSV
jgi:HSP20 family molecular chaperone IbpA